MPAKTLWLLHIPEIVSQLETFDVPVVDRAIIERLFGLRRRVRVSGRGRGGLPVCEKPPLRSAL
jgi:hypothetical protein